MTQDTVQTKRERREFVALCKRVARDLGPAASACKRGSKNDQARLYALCIADPDAFYGKPQV